MKLHYVFIYYPFINRKMNSQDVLLHQSPLSLSLYLSKAYTVFHNDKA